MGCLLILLFSFAVQKILSLTLSHLLPLLLYGDKSSHYQNQCQGDYSLYFLLHLLWFQVFKSLTHFDLIFVNGVKIVVQFYSTYGCSVFLLLQLFNIVSNQDVACIQLFPSRLLWIFGSSVVSYIYFRIVLIL